MSAAEPGRDSAGGGLPAEQPEMWSRERVVTGWAQLWNVPNMLTVLRILLIPVFWVLLMFDDGQNAGTRLAATALFMVASYTDWLDGHLARKQGLVTTFGKIADPMADKALTGVALIGLSVLDELPWWVTLLIILREVGVTLVRFVVLKHGVIPASRGGKAKTVLQMLAIVLYLLPLDSDNPVVWWTRAVVMALALALTLVTGLDYMGRAYRTRRDSKAARRARATAAVADRRPAATGPAGSAPGSTGAPRGAADHSREVPEGPP
ncbi:MAG TPA: CDP-diacylglycerol--glycerol-3-phosphate 3-phosphatidyltransferase [Candidatus Nanopelagicales bacterium]